MTTYAATFKSGATWTRNSKRHFTHAILVTDTLYGNIPVTYWASSLNLAEAKGKATAQHGYQAYEVAEAYEVGEDFIAS